MRAVPRILLAVAWLVTALSKVVWPATSEFADLGMLVGVPWLIVAPTYWVITTVECLVGVGLLAGSHRSRCAKLSLLLSGGLGLAWLALDPLDRACGCFGRLDHLGRAEKGAYLVGLLLLSWWSLRCLPGSGSKSSRPPLASRPCPEDALAATPPAGV